MSVGGEFLSRLLVRHCIVCGAVIGPEAEDSAFCAGCGRAVSRELCGLCPDCGRRYALCRCVPQALRDEGVRELHYIARYAPSSGDKMRVLLLRMKRIRLQKAYGFIAAQLAAQLAPKIGGRPGWLVTNIPRRKSGLKRFGLDQAEGTARALAKELGIPYRRLLRKTSEEEQKTLGYEERLQAVRGSYVLTDPKAVRGRSVLLVDDIVTSGASMAEGVRLLREHHAEEICVAAAAKTVRTVS